MSTLKCNWIILSLFLIIAVFATTALYSQNRFSMTSRSTHSAGPMGRDFWFGIPQNNDSAQFGYSISYSLYITSSKTTVVNIEDPVLGLIKKQVAANSTVALSSERGELSKSGIISSGVVEKKTFHIWSEDAGLSVEFVSRSGQSTDGMYCLPTSGWGTEYVVASYGSYPSAQVNFPSEFIIIASQDSTAVTITPSDSIHKNGQPFVNDHPKGQAFTVVLKRGELMQFQSVISTKTSLDLTGTVISSDKPIGVIGASACPNISSSDAPCDHILDMMQPIRCWGREYLTGPFAGRKYGGDLFLLVTSQDNQSIKRNGVFVFMGNKHDHLFTEVSEPSIWSSDQPFMLVQYMQSATHGAPSPAQRNLGDPAMAVVNAVNQYNSSVQFSIPTSPTSLIYTNYINILIPVNHESATTIDGKLLTNLPSSLLLLTKKPIPGTQWEVVTLKSSISSPSAGCHVIQSDSLIEATIYGLATDESYAFPAHLGTHTSFSADTVAPLVTDFSQECSLATLVLSDGTPLGTGLSDITIDSTTNMSVSVGAPLKLGDDSTFIFYSLIDSSKGGYASTIITDIAGNSRIVEIAAAADTPRVAFSETVSKSVKDAALDTITIFIHNASSSSVHLSNIFLQQNTDKFTLLSGASLTIAPGADGEVLIAVTLTESSSLATTLHFTEGCHNYTIDVSAEKGSEGFSVTDADFKCIAIGSVKEDSIRITNLSTTTTILIDSIWISAPAIFQYSGSALPITFVPEQSKYASVRFMPIGVTDTTVSISFRSTSGKIQSASLHGCTLQSGVEDHALLSGFSVQPIIPNPVNDGALLTLGFTFSKSSIVGLELFDQLGNKAAVLLSKARYPEGTFSEQVVLPLGLSAGSYYYRYTINGEHTSGKLIITK
jgi:hypothetical protein